MVYRSDTIYAILCIIRAITIQSQVAHRSMSSPPPNRDELISDFTAMSGTTPAVVCLEPRFLP